MPARIEDYGLIGDGETAALVHRNGSIDWLCWPRFDSDACFAALLGTAENGRWKIAPCGDATIERRYRTDTLILETDFETAEGAARLIDFMPIRKGSSILIRMVRGLRGRTRLRSELDLRFDYGSMAPWIELKGKHSIARVGPDVVEHHAPSPLRLSGKVLETSLEVDEGNEFSFFLVYGGSDASATDEHDAATMLTATERYWREWIQRFEKPTSWPEAVRRSLITLKSMIYRPSGGVIAAPTTSLPEAPAGDMNWDYRFSWLRDATFTLSALIDAGYLDEARDWRDWLLRAVAGEPDKMRIMYRVDGARRLEEWTVPWLPGFRWASPVRVGNAAAGQRQLDVFGELMDSIHVASKAGIKRTERERTLEDAIVRHVECVWRLPDHGLWEVRGTERYYVYSKVSAWVAIDRYLGSRRASAGEPQRLGRLADLRSRMHREICNEGYDRGLGRFVEYYGGQELDASLLLLPLMGFLPVDGERIAGTIAAIERELIEDGLVRRNKATDRNSEGAFLACTCWLADCQVLQGRAEAARATFERVLSVRNDLGLLAEEYNPKARCLAGNFPQALSHLALIRTALRLSGSVTERNGAP